LKSSNPYNEAIRDLADGELFDDGRILTLRFIDIFQRNEILKTSFSKIYKHWKSRLKELVTSNVDNLRSLFSELTFCPNTFSEG
jgi:NAD-dependent SIR2 family protein deacetylase